MESKDPQSICSIVRQRETQHISGVSNLSKYVTFQLAENINKIEAYLNSMHISGPKDSQDRDKPFFNIVRGAVNLWYRATDLDRKDIRIKAPNARHILLAFVATALLKAWMIESRFGTFLNDWGRVLSRYGSAVVEFVEKQGKLIPSVLPWNRLIIDAIDFDQNPVIKLLELTEAELRLNPLYDVAQIDALVNAYTTRKTKENLPQDTNLGYIKLYEVHGSFPLWHITGKEADKRVYVQQMQVCAFVGKDGKDDEYDDFVLFKGREKDPHMITHLIEEDGRSMAIGAVENLFEAQWMTNHSVKAMKDQLDIAGKLLYQTADGNFESQNVLTDLENGDILVHKPNMPLNIIQSNSHDLNSLQNFANMWRALGNEINSTPAVMSGGGLPSGTSWRLGQSLMNQATANFEAMRQNKGLAIEEMMRRFIIPFLKKKMNHAKEIEAVLEADDISQIDSAFIATEATKRLKRKAIDALVKGEVPNDLNMASVSNDVQAELGMMGDHRFLKPSEIPDVTWQMLLKDFEMVAIVDVTGEYENKDAVLKTLDSVLQSMLNPNFQNVIQTPEGKTVFNKILETAAAISPLEIPSRPSSPVASSIQPQTVRQPAPVGGGTAVGGGA